jgi:hypothetical protein
MELQDKSSEFIEYRKLFSDIDWQTLQFSIFWMFNSVAKADGKIDKKEKESLIRLTQNSSMLENDLAREIVASINGYLEGIWVKFEYDKREIIDGLREVSNLLNARVSPDEAKNFKKTLIAMGFYVANSSGKWFGSKVCAEEGIAIKLAAQNLRLSTADLDSYPSISHVFDNLK